MDVFTLWILSIMFSNTGWLVSWGLDSCVRKGTQWQTLMHICMLSLAYFVLFVSVSLPKYPYSFILVLSCFHLSMCLCVYVFVCLRCPLSGSFDLFNASNGTSKEDFSEFDSLRSSSSVPTGTHPCLCLAIDTVSVLFFLSVWNDALLQMQCFCGAQTHECLVLICKYDQTWARTVLEPPESCF